MHIELVKQEDEFGCVPACFAMVMRMKYADITKWFHNDFSVQGINLDKSIAFIADHGYTIIKKELSWYNRNDIWRQELLKPFAEVHILDIKQYFDVEHNHAVVMDYKGDLFCPNGAEDIAIRNSYDFYSVYGIYRH